MSRESMSIEQFNYFMRRCATMHKVRYVTPTIHPRTKKIMAINIDTDEDTFIFDVTNNPNEDYNLTREVHGFLDNLVNQQSE